MKDWKFIANKWILRRGPKRYESKVRRRLSRFKGQLFVDIGANRGTYTIALSRNFLQVFAFEPNPNILPFLEGQLASRKISNVKVFRIALGDTVGKTMLYLDPHVGFVGSTETIMPLFEYQPNVIPDGGAPREYRGRSGVEVPVSTYDTVVSQTADLVKIDVEGAEFLVLKGMRQSIENLLVKNLIIELHNRERRQELEEILKRYDLEWVDSDHLLASLPAG